jgi:isopentenyl diphosphate isomerase/L-lactate dehydrogenase-like FMN-dependent dehydrogenase
MLPEVVEVAKEHGKEVVIDGGIMRGSHVLKALALGADCVFLGRPVLWGISAEGQEGVENVLRILN